MIVCSCLFDWLCVCLCVCLFACSIGFVRALFVVPLSVYMFVCVFVWVVCSLFVCAVCLVACLFDGAFVYELLHESVSTTISSLD